MICPTCKHDMVVVEHHKVEFDYCTNCHGVWFDSGELELWLESAHLESTDKFVGDVLNAPEARTTEQHRKCPICRENMKKTHIIEQPEILIDVCKRGDGLWFDGGEVDHMTRELTKPGETNSHHQMVALLEDVFQAHEPKQP